LKWRKAVKRPSEWLRVLCKEWAMDNEALVYACDEKFLDYKPYLKGLLTSQLLCRLSIPIHHHHKDLIMDGHHFDFWRILGIVDEFDKSYIIAQIERFCAMYNIRGLPEENDTLFAPGIAQQDATAAAVGINGSPPHGGPALGGMHQRDNGGLPPPQPYMDSHMEAPSTAMPASAATVADPPGKLSKKQNPEVSRAQRQAKDAEKALEQERRQTLKKEQRRISQERKEQKQREREEMLARKAADRAQREASREDRRRKKLEIRVEREKFAQQQKELALKRAAELVSSNRVPIEITRGAAAAKAAASAALVTGVPEPAPEPTVVVRPPSKKARSAIVVSTAADLHQIVTHSKNLWAKYNAIAKEHNQKVNWITVANELGIHVKVREKYARMHSRAEQRGFDWKKNGHWKIKDHPEIFVEPTESEQKARMPLPPPDTSTTVLIAGNKEVPHVLPREQQQQQHQIAQNYQLQPQSMHYPQQQQQQVTEEAVAAAARVVDAAGVNMVSPTEEQAAAAAAVAASMVADSTDNMMKGEEQSYHPEDVTV